MSGRVDVMEPPEHRDQKIDIFLKRVNYEESLLFLLGEALWGPSCRVAALSAVG